MVEKRCGFIALIGQPNVGKSTLLNRLVGMKISIVSHKVQTTRRKILGMMIKDNAQLIFMDTPGIFTPKKRLDRAMVKSAWNAAQEADVDVVMVDCTHPDLTDVDAILTQAQKKSRALYVVLNKIDQVSDDDVAVIQDHVKHHLPMDRIFKLSAMTGDGVDALIDTLIEMMPQGPWLYPEEQITDLPMRLMAADITREKILERIHQEVPYDITVETDQWETFRNGSVKISQTIHVKRASQKAIVLGHQGRAIKDVSAKARLMMEEVFGMKVHLFVFVKVSESWMDDPHFYHNEGLDFKS